MRRNRTSKWNVMTIWISWGLPLCNFERHGILCPRIVHPCEMLWPLGFSRGSVIQCRVSWYIISLNWTSMWKVMITWIPESFHCRILSVSIYYASESDFLVKSYDHFNFSTASIVLFRESRYIMLQNQTSEWKVMTIWTSWVLPLFNLERLNILCVWIGLLSEKLWPF